MIYFMQSVAGGPVKIGYSIDVDRRREQLEAHYGTPLVVLAVSEGGIEEEREIHDRFAHLRFPNLAPSGRGRRLEQFRPDAELMAFIGRPLLVDPNPDAVEAMPAVGGKRSLASLKGSEDYSVWFNGLVDFSHLPASILIEHALREWAENHGYGKTQPKR